MSVLKSSEGYGSGGGEAVWIVGARVWLDGEMPGRIAYLGETGFGTGEWAGVVLEAAAGKHSGTVGGRQYFQCEPGHGVFCRISRLHISPSAGVCDEHGPATAAPKAPPRRTTSPSKSRHGRLSNSPSKDARAYSPHKTVSASAKGCRERVGRLTDEFDTRVKGSVRKDVSRGWSEGAPEAASQNIGNNLSLGDRVEVRCTDGTWTGTLRFLGLTQFGSGFWAGVELNSGGGKNDGCVAGTRYFECAEQCGLFAPVSRVCPTKNAKLAALAVPKSHFSFDDCY